ncbi:MAG TPA: glycosyltransferase [Candidatus Scalindua sp.]|nr:glycosyltransferase [Candidatus Scalindua sp.]
MKVALVTFYAGHVRRGVETWAYELRKRLPGETKVFSLYESNWTTKVDSLKMADPIYKYYIYYAKCIEYTRYLRKFRLFTPSFLSLYYDGDLALLVYALNLFSPLKKFNPDIIVNHVGFYCGTMLRFYRALYKTPFISVGGAGKGVTEIKNIRTRPNCYVAQTPSIKKFLERKAPNVPIELIPNGADLDLLDPSKNRFTYAELGQMAHIKNPLIEHPLILSTSALLDGKRLDFLTQAVAKLKKCTLVFAGNGEAKEKLVSLGENLLGRRFIYVGILARETLATLYRTCDVFCLPSFHEPFGNVFVEAMAANIPVVAHRDEDREWMVGEKGGILTDASDVNKLGSALKEAAQRDWADGPRKNSKRFSWDLIAEKYVSLIEKVLLQSHR